MEQKNLYTKLIAQDLHKTFIQGDKKLLVLNGISFEFEQNKSYAIVGVSGSGKSTLMHILGSLDKPDIGEVLFSNKNLFKLKEFEKEKFLNTNMGFVFQFHYLIKELSVIENIILPGIIKGENKKSCLEKAEALLQEVDLKDKMHDYPTTLSGGQQQRVSILRAIFNKPSFLLADEPTGNLDENNAQSVINLILKYKKEFNMGIIICSHDPEIYNKMETVLKLHEGKLG
ncbi:ABC transporter ATP-binding protein [Candidatus Babeliales bacterium]|nr:ABC transporter ATP-binding protein [Candidatus Babeliales bacterium]MCF7899807.1 ABC transporter ATP-binding protein [Candidatus Babeliales bacterium]